MSDTIMNGDANNDTGASQSSQDSGATDAGKTATNPPADGSKSSQDKSAQPGGWLNDDDKSSDKDAKPEDNKDKSDADKSDKDDKSKDDKGKDDKKADGDKGDSDKEGDDDKKDEPDGAPEEYADFTFADGIEPDEATLGEFKTVAKELNLNQEQAQGLIDLQNKMELARAEAYQTEVNGWIESAKSDKEFGGKDFEQNAAIANKALKEYGTPELITMLKETRLGNHPEVIRTFYKIGKQLEEGSVRRASSQSGSPKKLTDIYD